MITKKQRLVRSYYFQLAAQQILDAQRNITWTQLRCCFELATRRVL